MARELADDLRRWLGGEPIQARPVSAGERAWRWARRRPAVSALLGAVILVATLGLAGIVWQWQRAESKAAAEATANDKLERNLYFTRIALAEREWTANNRTRMDELLELCRPDLRGWEWYCLRWLRYNRLITFDHGSPITALGYSPDGKRLAAASGGVNKWEVIIRDPATGQ